MYNIEKRSIAVAIILTIVTCGLYSIYWVIKLNDEVNQLSGNLQDTSGGMVVVLTIITCGIYGCYWAYKMGQKCDTISGRNDSSHVIYLVLSIFRLDIIAYCLMQDTINKYVG